MKYFLSLLVLFLPHGLWAQQPVFEKNSITFQDGSFAEGNLHYDPTTDVLSLRSENGHQVLSAGEVESFRWNGQFYYSLNLNNQPAFFRVLHEGSQFAVLHKAAGQQLYQFFVEESRGALQICEEEEAKIVLCEKQIGPSFGMPAFAEASVSYLVEDAVFLAVDDDLHLVNFKFDTRGEIFATVPGLKKNNRRTLRRLKHVIDDAHQMQQLKQYVVTSKADLQDPEQLILALKTIYP